MVDVTGITKGGTAVAETTRTASRGAGVSAGTAPGARDSAPERAPDGVRAAGASGGFGSLALVQLLSRDVSAADQPKLGRSG